jgi:hypothetical protein
MPSYTAAIFLRQSSLRSDVELWQPPKFYVHGSPPQLNRSAKRSKVKMMISGHKYTPNSY